MKRSILAIFMIMAMLAATYPAAYADTVPISAPQSLSAQILQSYILLGTSDKIPAGQTTQLEKCVDSGDFYFIAELSPGNETYKDYNLTNGHIYKYRARRFKGSTYSAYSNEAEVVYIYPLSLSIENVYSNQIDLSWTYPQAAESAPANYQTVIERRASNESSWKVIYSAPMMQREYRDIGLKPDTVYYYRIRTLYPNAYYSPYIPDTTGTYERTSISLTTPLTGYAVSGTQIKLEWDASSLAGTTAVIEKMDSQGEFEGIFSDKTVDHYSDSGLTAGKQYYYRLSQVSDNGSVSNYSETLCVRAETIQSPLNIKVSPVSQGYVSVSWEYPYDAESGFEVWRREDGAIWQKLDSPSRNTTSWMDYSAALNKTYTYKVRAVRGDDVFSDFIASSPVNNADPDTPPPLVIIPLSYYLLIGTNNAPPPGITYTLEFRTGMNENWTDHTSTVPGKPLIAEFLLSSGKEFDVRLRSENKGNAKYGQIRHVYAEKPEAPAALAIPCMGYGKVLLTWRDNTEKEDGYRIYRTIGGQRTLIGTTGADQVTFEDPKVIPGSTVKYEVCAFNLRGESGYATIGATIPKKAVFSDITGILWGVDAVNTLCAMGAVSQGSNGLFYPNRTVTLAEFTTMLMKTFNIVPQPGYLFTLKDVPANAWYYPYMMTAVKLGIVIPDVHGNVGPLNPVTGAGAAVLLDRLASCRNQLLNANNASILDKFQDGSLVQDELKEIVASLAGDSIIPAQNGQPLNLGRSTTRIEAAAIIYKFYLKYR